MLPTPIGKHTHQHQCTHEKSQTVAAIFIVCSWKYCAQTMVWLPLFEIFHVCTDVDACECAHTVRAWALEADSGRKNPCLTRDSNPHQYCSRLFSWTLYQLSYSCPLCVGQWCPPCELDSNVFSSGSSLGQVTNCSLWQTLQHRQFQKFSLACRSTPGEALPIDPGRYSMHG